MAGVSRATTLFLQQLAQGVLLESSAGRRSSFLLPVANQSSSYHFSSGEWD
jgi:hypothetical protein